MSTNPRVLQAAYNLLLQSQTTTPQQKVIRRLASRWIAANLALAYDIFTRLQILEGAAGVPVDSWWKKGKVILPQVLSKFETATLDPAWTSPGNTGVYAILKANLKSLAATTGVGSDPDEILNSALLGLGVDPSEPKQILRPAYEVGKYLAHAIKSGEESPISVAKGPLKTLLKRRILTEARNRSRDQSLERQTDDGDSETQDITDQNTRDAGDLLLDILFQDFTDPLGQQIRNFMRTTWRGSKEQVFMDRWLDLLEGNQTIPSKLEVAKSLGMGMANYTAKYWVPAWTRFFNQFWDNVPIQKALEKRYLQEGLSWSLEEPELENVFNQLLQRGFKTASLRLNKHSRLVLQNSFLRKISL